ncbi:MAG: biopolymer transporter ExbD [Bacteroidales bacterium]|nr:biopolymer transporter ExbD [Bacteroidales bacterium]MBN2821463.1 biopolymer transporter ExbD [Bacteroidales bacterium]
MAGGRFKKKGKNKIQAISTASLPDIVFMLLFFFMVTTVMKQDDLKVSIHAPKATEVKKLENKSLVSYIYIGKPTQTRIYGDVTQIQLNDAFADPDQIREFIAAERETMDEADQSKMTVSLKVDGKTEMGIVTDVKQQLRRASALKINYSTLKGDPLGGR